MNFNYFTVTGFGNANTLAFETFTVGSASITNGLFNQDGNVRLTIGACVNCNFVVQNVSFTNPKDAIDSMVFDFYATAAQNGGTRLMQNVTAASHVQTSRFTANISLPSMKTGTSFNGGDPGDINGFVGYNVALVQTTTSALLADLPQHRASSSTPAVRSRLATDSVITPACSFQDGFCLDRVPNQHEIVTSTPPPAARATLYQRYLCDGDGFYNADTGDMIQDWGTYTMKNSIGLNFCGTMSTISNSTREVATLNREHQLQQLRGDLLRVGLLRRRASGVPRQPYRKARRREWTEAFAGTMEFTQRPSLFARQISRSITTAFIRCPAAEIPERNRSRRCPALLPNPALGGIVSYVNIPAAIVGGQGNKLITTVTDSTHIGCATCNFTQAGAAGVMPGDYFEDITPEAGRHGGQRDRCHASGSEQPRH